MSSRNISTNIFCQLRVNPNLVSDADRSSKSPSSSSPSFKGGGGSSFEDSDGGEEDPRTELEVR